MPTSNPPLRNAAAYGGRRDVACAQLCSSMNREQSQYARLQFISLLHEDMVSDAHTGDLKLEFEGNAYRSLYYMYCMSCVVSIISLILAPYSHTLLFSLADPISAAL